MENKYIKILIIVAAFLVLSLVTTASYAYFVASLQGNENASNNVITTGDVALYFSDDDLNIKLSNAYPTQSVIKEFGIVNIGNVDTIYNVYLSNIINTFADKNDLVFTIESVDAQDMFPNVISATGCSNLNERVVPSVVGEESNIVSSCQISPGQLHLYRMTITFKDDGTNQDDNKGKKFSAVVSVNDYYSNLNQVAILEEGHLFNRDIKQLAGNNAPTYETKDENINRIEFSSTAPSEEDNYMYVESGETVTDIKAWFNNGTVYIYSPQDTIYLPENSSYMFSGFENLTYLDLSNFDTSNVTNMHDMFKDIDSLTSLDISSFDTSNVTNMTGMFASCDDVEHINLGQNFNTSKVTTMSSMFHNTLSLQEIDLSNFDTSKVTDMSWMFCASAVRSLDLSSFNTSRVTNMHAMIINMEYISSINLGNNFDTSNVTDMYQLFRNIKKVTTLDLGNKFSVEKVEDAQGMFMQDATPRNIVTIKSNKDLVFKTGTITEKIFYKTSTIVGGKGTVFNTSYQSTNGYKYAVIDCGTKRPGYLTFRGTEEEYEEFCSNFN